MRPSLSVEVPAFGAPIIHLSSKQAREDRAQDEDPPEHGDGQQSIGQAFHLLPIIADGRSSFGCKLVEIAAALLEQPVSNQSRYHVEHLPARIRIVAARFKESVQVESVTVHLRE